MTNEAAPGDLPKDPPAEAPPPAVVTVLTAAPSAEAPAAGQR
jgi:hypothetical protein